MVMSMDLKTNVCECMETGTCTCSALICECDCGCENCVREAIGCACGGNGQCQCGMQA